MAPPSRVLIFGPLPPGPYHSQLRIATGQEDIAGEVFVLHTAAFQVRTALAPVRRPYVMEEFRFLLYCPMNHYLFGILDNASSRVPRQYI